MKLTTAEMKHCDNIFQDDWEKEYQYAGSFQTSLMRTVECADEINLKKLMSVYPNLVRSYLYYCSPNSLRKE